MSGRPPPDVAAAQDGINYLAGTGKSVAYSYGSLSDEDISSDDDESIAHSVDRLRDHVGCPERRQERKDAKMAQKAEKRAQRAGKRTVRRGGSQDEERRWRLVVSFRQPIL